MTTPSLRASLAAPLIALSVLASGPVLAQATGEDDETTTIVEGQADTTVVEGGTDAVETQAVETVATTDDDRGFNPGWLGLLGLLGLAGLGGRRRETVTTVTTHPTVTTDPLVTTRPTTSR